jgi:hypothetical protein
MNGSGMWPLIWGAVKLVIPSLPWMCRRCQVGFCTVLQPSLSLCVCFSTAMNKHAVYESKGSLACQSYARAQKIYSPPLDVVQYYGILGDILALSLSFTHFCCPVTCCFPYTPIFTHTPFLAYYYQQYRLWRLVQQVLVHRNTKILFLINNVRSNTYV